VPCRSLLSSEFHGLELCRRQARNGHHDCAPYRIVAAPVVIHHRVIRELRVENDSLRGQIEQLAQLAGKPRPLEPARPGSILQIPSNDPRESSQIAWRGWAALRRRITGVSATDDAQSSRGPQDSFQQPQHLGSDFAKDGSSSHPGQAGLCAVKTLTDQLQDKAPD